MEVPLSCFAVVGAKCVRSSDVKRVSLCFMSWVLLIITAPLEPHRELTFDPNKSGRTGAVRLVQFLLCCLKRMEACLDTAASDRIGPSSGPVHYCSHSTLFFAPGGAFSLKIVLSQPFVCIFSLFCLYFLLCFSKNRVFLLFCFQNWIWENTKHIPNINGKLVFSSRLFFYRHLRKV